MSPPESELERFFDLSLDLLVIAGLDGHMKRVNPAYARTLGFPVEQLLARPMLDVVHPDDVQSVVEMLGGLVHGEDVVAFENRVICADGSVRWLQWNTRAMPEQGIVYGVGRDVTTGRRGSTPTTRRLIRGRPSGPSVSAPRWRARSSSKASCGERSPPHRCTTPSPVRPSDG